ncbi:MAG: hypothetical protein LC109_12680 [Bacteroidia bacterium]|nr:hypothetical protein [Bacteroidia bacterium]
MNRQIAKPFAKIKRAASHRTSQPKCSTFYFALRFQAHPPPDNQTKDL